MSGGGTVRASTDDLLALALSRPREALARSRAVLARQPDPYDASVAHQAMAIVLRDFGDVRAGVAELREALRLARRSGSADRETDVLGSLGAALVYAGRTSSGLSLLDQAVQRSTGPLAARNLVRRGIMLEAVGRYQAAQEDLRSAIGMLRRADDSLYLARALMARAVVHLEMGAPGAASRADSDLAAAGRLFTAAGQELEASLTVGNRANVAFASGDLPAALAYLDTATAAYQRLRVPTVSLHIDRCEVLLAAGMAVDALAEADTALAEMDQIRGRVTKKAQLLLMAANAALAAAKPEVARDRAQAAYRLFRAQRSDWWQARAARVLAEARYRAGPPSARLLRQADKVAAELDALGATDTAQAHLLAGRIALDLGRRDDAEHHLITAGRTRRRGPALSRASGWLAEALRAEAANRPDRMLSACRYGLDVLDEHRLTLGASELRAQATVHGTELASLALRHAARARRPRQLLTWSERWRTTAEVVPAVRPLADADINASLAALRKVTRDVERASKPGLSLLRRQQSLERTVRASALRARSSGGPDRSVFSPADLMDELGQARLVEIIDVDNRLYVLVCGQGRVRQFEAGLLGDAARAADFARFALRRLARGRPGDDRDSALSILAAAGPRLQQALLGPAAQHLGDGPVIIVPTGTLQPLPWGLLPALRDRPVSVAPSARAWMRARTAPAPDHRRVMLACGPGLGSEGAEVPLVAKLYDDVTVLDDVAATAEKVLHALDGVWLAHIAAHGSFRADSPLFSSLHMHDGPLTVYDFEQLRRAPYRLVLSSCDSGVLAPTGSNELLGLVSSLLPLGTAGIMAAIVPLNDLVVVPLMVDLHRYLHQGYTLAESAARVREGLDDPIELATAASMLTLGAA